MLSAWINSSRRITDCKATKRRDTLVTALGSGPYRLATLNLSDKTYDDLVKKLTALQLYSFSGDATFWT